MAGAGKRRAAATRREQQSSTEDSGARTSAGDTATLEKPSDTQPKAESQPATSENKSRSGSQADMPTQFPAGIGYDPARDPSSVDMVPRRLELPSDAYILGEKSLADVGQLPVRPARQEVGKEIMVRVNQFRVINWPQKPVYQYDVQIGNGSEKLGYVRFVWNTPTLQAKLRAISPIWLFDNKKIAWSSGSAGPRELRILINLDEERGRAPRANKEADVCRVVIRETKAINMAVISGYLQRKMSFDNSVLEAINFLDHALRQSPSEKFTMIKRSFFMRDEKKIYQSLDNYVQAIRGVYSSIRLCSPFPVGQGTGLGVNVDVSNATFWMPQALHQAARNLCRARNRNLDYKLFRDNLRPVAFENSFTMSSDMKELRKMVKLKFRVNHRGKTNEDKIYTIKSFAFHPHYGPQGGHSKNAKFTQVDRETGKSVELSVYDYFRDRYGIYLEFWELPLVETTKDGMFPMEVCYIIPEQRFQYKLDPAQTAAMIKFAVTRPAARLKSITESVGMLDWDNDRYLKHFGIKIDRNFTVTKGRLLPNPEVQFGGRGPSSKINPRLDGRWDLRGKIFLKPNTSPLTSWGIGIIGEAVDKDTAKAFMRVFMRAYTDHGGNIANRTPVIFEQNSLSPGDFVAHMMKTINETCKMHPQIIFFILPDKHSFMYERLKKSMDCRFGVASQMLQKLHVERANPQYCSNVSMKVNAKLGGTTSRCVSNGTKAQEGKPTFTVPTVIIGADVSHPSPGSPQASMAALTMSMDRDACRYAAAVQTNGIRVEMVTPHNMRHMMIPLLERWIATVGGGKGPQHIYYFRDGVSEGQYMHVLQREVNDMRLAISQRWNAEVANNIKFLVVVASKRHHIRFFPKENDRQTGDKNGNVHPGTVIEKDVTHPFEYDFYMNSHSAIQGTARPVHYHVLRDDLKLPTHLLQQMIYDHCYQYMRSTTPVSLFPAIYYAHLASNRARSHEDAAASSGPRGGQKFLEIEQDKSILRSMRGEQTVPLRSTETEPLALLNLGLTLQPNQVKEKNELLTSMWYI